MCFVGFGRKKHFYGFDGKIFFAVLAEKFALKSLAESAIKEVEARATGGKIESGDSVTSMANEAVARNKKIGKEDDKKIRLRDIVAEIDVKVTRDRSVTSEDAEAVVQAELNHSPYNHVIPGGVAESVAAAYKLNRSPSM